jgi:hypothetical protein
MLRSLTTYSSRLRLSEMSAMSFMPAVCATAARVTLPPLVFQFQRDTPKILGPLGKCWPLGQKTEVSLAPSRETRGKRNSSVRSGDFLSRAGSQPSDDSAKRTPGAAVFAFELLARDFPVVLPVTLRTAARLPKVIRTIGDHLIGDVVGRLIVVVWHIVNLSHGFCEGSVIALAAKFGQYQQC